ncbi:MAG: MerR family transcriptional regulator [Alphaproteobacteria bacterium]|nr:MerR family transcriptional regulator [Alphaproteobacteria bacterium]
MAEAAAPPPDRARAGKSENAFRTISEVAEELDLPQHVLRFWETKFSQVRPLKRGGGRRYYRPEDVELLRRIRTLLYRDGYTIKGVQKLLRAAKGANDGEEDMAAATATVSAGGLSPTARAEIEAAIAELDELRDLLRGHLK